MRIRGIFGFFGEKIHSIVRNKPRRIEHIDETARTNPIPSQPKRTVPFLSKREKERKPDAAELERIKRAKEKARQARRNAEGTGHEFDRDA